MLFRIGANSDDAEDNIARFRTLLSKDLSDISGEFSDWSSKILGDISTVQGAATAGAAVLAAGIVAVGVAANEAANHYEAYVEEIARGSKTTGISVEAMSGLHYAAEKTNTSYDALVHGLTRFSTTVVKASQGGQQQMEMFQALGISQEQVKAGQKDMLPLLMLVSDKFHGLSSQQQRTAMASALMRDRMGDLLPFLSQGSARLKELAEEARKAGAVIGKDDVDAMKAAKAMVIATKEQMEALEIVVGRAELPFKTFWAQMKAGAEQAVISMFHWKYALLAILDPAKALNVLTTETAINMAALDEEAKKLQASGALGQNAVVPPPAKIKEAAASFTGLSDVLHEVTDKMADSANVASRANKEYSDMAEKVDKATTKFKELHAAGKLSTEDLKTQTAALAQLSIGARITSHSGRNRVVPARSAVVSGDADLPHPGGGGLDADRIVFPIQKGLHF